MIRLQFCQAVLTTLLLTCEAAPILPNVSIIAYQSEPETRGTFSLLYSCLTTLILCVWTAVHLNVEPLQFSRSKLAGPSRLVGKLIWGFTALVAPEIVLSIALHQFLVAQHYRQILNKSVEIPYAGLKEEPKEKPKEESKEKSKEGRTDRATGNGQGNMKKAFYAIMGGFAKGGYENEFTLDINMLIDPAVVKDICNYPLAEINDKSKADYLAKGLACIQAAWMLIQCLGRKLQGLPITLLELNTVLHVVNAITMYVLWWDKPVDISRPSIINEHGETSTKRSFVGAEVLKQNLRTVRNRILPELPSKYEDSWECYSIMAYIDYADKLDKRIKSDLDKRATLTKTFRTGTKLIGGIFEAQYFRRRVEVDLSVTSEDLCTYLNHGIYVALCETTRGPAQEAVDVDDLIPADDAVWEAFHETVRETIPTAVWKTVSKAVPEAAREAIQEAYREAFRETAQEAVWEATPKAVWEDVREAIREAVREATPKAVNEAIREALNKFFGSLMEGVDFIIGDPTEMHDVPKRFITNVIVRARLFQIVYKVVTNESKEENREDDSKVIEKGFEEVFSAVKQYAQSIASSTTSENEIRAMADKVAFHLDPYSYNVEEPQSSGDKSKFLEKLHRSDVV